MFICIDVARGHWGFMFRIEDSLCQTMVLHQRV
jgi:hypothetical protein